MRTPLPRWLPLLLTAASFACSGCSSSLPVVGGRAAKVTVAVEGAPDCNNCRTRTASSLKLRIFQVADSSAIRTVLNNKTLSWSKQLDAAAANVLGKPVEEYVGPGVGKSVTVERDPKAIAIVIEGNFCEKSGADWYYIHPAKRKSVGLRAGATGFALTTGK